MEFTCPHCSFRATIPVADILNRIDENYEPNPWLEGKDILNVIRVKQGEEIDGLRRILYAIENSGTSILHYI